MSDYGQPFQQQPKKKHPVRNAFIAGGVAAVALVATVALFPGNSADKAAHTASQGVVPVGTATPTTTPSATVKPTTKPSVKPSPKVTHKPAPTTTKPVAPAATASQEQAIGKAEDYVDTMPFSRKGLIKQLEFDEFTAGDAAYAVDHITVSWNEQAGRKATDYLNAMHFSRASLIKQLEFDGFTHKQAVYGVTKAGL